MKNRKVTQLFAGLMVTAMVATGIVPPTTTMAAIKTVTIKTQKQLQEALKDKNVTSIIIKTSKGTTFTIKDGDYGKKNLIVSAPKATIKNSGDFNRIEIRDSKTVYDKGDGNNILIKDTNFLKFVASVKSSDSKITVSTAAKGGKISIVNNGSVDAINVKAKSSVTVSGSAKEAPTITNNATGSKIVTTQDANVVLNKKSSFTVKSGATLESLTMNADAAVKISAGAVVKELSIAGNASTVALKIDGTVGSVAVNTKADVAVSGNTTGTVAITNNAEGAEISSSVKTDVTLNADAKVSLDKGAEGSSVTAGNENVKPDVTNNTSESVTVTDSTGKDTTIDSGSTSSTSTGTGDQDSSNKDNATGSGSTGGSTGDSGNNGGGSVTAATITPTISISGSSTLDVGSTLEASATNSKGDADVVYTYVWKFNGCQIGEGASFNVTGQYSGGRITLEASATIDGKTVTGTATTDVIPTVAVQDDKTYTQVSVDNGTELDDAVASLESSVYVNDSFGHYALCDINWDLTSISPEYNGESAGKYVFTGTPVLPAGWKWTESASTITQTVVVLAENPLQFDIAVPTELGEIPDGSAGDSNADAEANQATISAEKNGYNVFITGNTMRLDAFAKETVGTQKWVAVNIVLDPSLTVTSVLKSGSADNNLQLVTTGDASEAASDNAYTVWLDAEAIKAAPQTIYFQNSDGAITPVNFYFFEEAIVLDGYTTEIPASVSGGTVGNVTDRNALGLPSEITFTVDGNSEETYTLPVDWYCNDDYGYGEHAKSFTFNSMITGDYPVELKSGVTMPTATVVIGKGSQSAPADLQKVSATATTIQAGNESEATNITYCINTENQLPETPSWVTSGLFTGLTADTDYYVFAKYTGNDDYEESAASTGLLIHTLKAAPQTPDAPELADGGATSESITVTSVDGQEYALGTTASAPTTEWQASGAFTGLSPETTYYIFTRVAATSDTEASAVSQPLAAATTKVPPKASESTIRIRTAADQTDSGDTAVDGYGSELGLVKQQDPDPTGATVYKLTGTVNCCTNPEAIVIDQESVQKLGYYVPLMITVDTDHATSASETAGINAMFTKTELSDDKNLAIVRAVNATDTQGYQSVLLYLPMNGAEKYYFELDLDGSGNYYQPSLYCIDISEAATAPVSLTAADLILFTAPAEMEAEREYLSANLAETLGLSVTTDSTIKVSGEISKDTTTDLDLFTAIDGTDIAAIGRVIGSGEEEVSYLKEELGEKDELSGQYKKTESGYVLRTRVGLSYMNEETVTLTASDPTIKINVYGQGIDGALSVMKQLTFTLDISEISLASE